MLPEKPVAHAHPERCTGKQCVEIRPIPVPPTSSKVQLICYLYSVSYWAVMNVSLDLKNWSFSTWKE